MRESQAFENYPAWMVLGSNLLTISMYLIGAAILYQAGVLWLVLYVLFVLLLELRPVKGHCTDCWYYGRTCAFEKRRLSCMFFPQGNS